MHIARTFAELAPVTDNVYLAIGVFDGVHLGHQRVIGHARDAARAGGGSSVVLTFDPHPLRVLQPDKAPLLLTATDHKLRLIAALGVDACLLLQFDAEFSRTPPAQFIEQVARATHHLREICVGTRFHFGHNRAGNVRLMEALAPQYGFTAKEITSVMAGEEMISSTAIRQHVLNGNLDRVAAMLGRPFSILGTVEKGDQIGRQLGFPTANLNPHNEVLPPDGVYVAQARLGTETLPGVVNIGLRPTLQTRRTDRRLEIYLLDFDRDIYDQELEVIFLKKLRDEQKFASLNDLRNQIAADVQAARATT